MAEQTVPSSPGFGSNNSDGGPRGDPHKGEGCKQCQVLVCHVVDAHLGLYFLKFLLQVVCSQMHIPGRS